MGVHAEPRRALAARLAGCINYTDFLNSGDYSTDDRCRKSLSAAAIRPWVRAHSRTLFPGRPKSTPGAHRERNLVMNKSSLLMLFAALALISASGCHAIQLAKPNQDLGVVGGASGTCTGEFPNARCGDVQRGKGMLGWLHGLCGRGSNPAGGPPAAAISYPYYTSRAPRDFLAANPPTIGN